MLNEIVFFVVSITFLVFLIVLGSRQKFNSNLLEKDARRLARLLIIEIRLYNDYKVTQGLKNQDLYTRLNNEIKEAEKIYKKRFNNANLLIFNETLIEILAEGDEKKLGSEYQTRAKK